MSLYKDASLVMIPSAYKDGKLYSIRPTDGSGDFTFSRGSNLAATRVDVNGLIEKGRENLLLQSNQFDTTWFNSNSTETGGQAGYDGSNDAWRIDLTGAAGYISQSLSQAGVQTASVYAKAGTLNFVRFRITGSGADKLVDVNLTNGSIGTTGGGNIDSQAVSIGNGWYRISLSCNTTPSAFLLYPIQADSDFTATSGNIYIQDAQVELGLVATDYIETGASTAQAGILEDMPRLDYSGGASCPSLLLEPQRTNLVKQSESFNDSYWTKSGTSVTGGFTSPEGLNNAYKLVEDTSTGDKNIYTSSIFITNSTSYSIHHYIKAGEKEIVGIQDVINSQYWASIDLINGVVLDEKTSGSTKVEPLTNGYYKVSCSFTSNTTSIRPSIFLLPDSYTTGRPSDQDYTGDGTSGIYVYGAQLEQGSYPTSYIPTYGTSQTRSADDFVLVLATDIVQNGGTFMIELEGAPRGAGTSTPFIQFNHTNSSSYVGFGATGNWRCRINDNGTAHLTTSPIPHTDNAKLCIRYGDFGYEYYANGSSFDTYGNAIELGDFSNISFSPNDVYGILRVKQFLTFPTALTDSECIALTTL